jgi:magnesium and cobalt exporter, CNNM family
MSSTFSSLLVGAISVIALVAANAFFVAAEFALVAARRTRIAALARDGDSKAILVQKAIQSLDRYISATQLGITLASLGLGWMGEPAIARVLQGFLSGVPQPFNAIATHGFAVAVAFGIITVLHIVLGELAPKAFALLHPEATSLWVTPPLMVFTVATNPIIYLLNGAANFTLRALGMRPPESHERLHQPEEIVMLARQSARGGQLARLDAQLIEGVFEFSEKVAHDVMTPRTDVIGLPADLTVGDAVARVAEAGRSRYPVFRESLDDVVGILHVKELLSGMIDGKDRLVSTLMTRPLFLPSTREIEDILTDMQRLKQHMGIVLDEYGGTAGIVTMEDLLEEIVGEIHDEYDVAPRDLDTGEGGTTIPGSMPFEEVNARYGLGLETDHFHTIGGYVFGRLGRLPQPGDTVQTDHAAFEVLTMEGNRIGSLRINKRPSE